MSRPVYLVDASIYIFQAYFSPHMQLLSDDNRDISAFYGFAQFLMRFLRQAQPAYVAAAFDESLFCGFRHTLYPAYKSNRELPDEALARQLDACAKLARLLGVASYGSRVYEADDIIGTLASRIRQSGIARSHESTSPVSPPDICIVSRDKDMAQLLRGARDHLWDFSGNSRRFRQQIIQQYGIRPEQFPDYLGLVGDAVDSIPGVPGLGPVAATCLLRHFESMPLLYEHLDEVPYLSYRGAAKAPDILRRYEDQARLSRTLATIVEDVSDPLEAFSAARNTCLAWGEIQSDAIRDLLVSEGLEAPLRDRFLMLLDGLRPVAVTGEAV